MLRRYDAVLSALDAGVVIHAADTEILEANDQARSLLGIKDLEGRLATDPAWEFLEEDGSAMALDRFPVMQVIASRQPLKHFVMIVRPPDAADAWFEVSAAPITDDAGDLQQVVVTFIDITRRRRDEVSLHQAARQLDEAERIAKMGHWTFDLASDHVYWSPALYETFSWDPHEPPPDFGQQAKIFTAESWERLQQVVDRAARLGEPYQIDLEIIRPDGTHGWIDARCEAVRDAAGKVVSLGGISIDITERRLADEQLLALATRDPLTGLANRATLHEEVALALAAARRSGRWTSLIMLDLDRFKDVNDVLGHPAGDQLLISAGQRLVDLVRGGDLVARIGGDEFVIVMRDIADPPEAVSAAERIVTAFRAPFAGDEGEIFATASVGVTMSQGDAAADDLLREADIAMYASKDQGRDRVSIFDERLRARVAQRLAIETELRRALQRGQLAVWYQPEVDLRTGQVRAAEALLRWIRPDGEVWSADQFVDVAEDTGLILDIGDWVLTVACAQAARWEQQHPGRRLMVRVNLSALQLAEDGLLPAVDDALHRSGLDPSLLCVEITETALLRRTKMASDNLAGIAERGISLAIDDFGTGYASLSYLDLYPVDTIKIDRSFIAGDSGHDSNYRLVAGIIALAEELDMTVTAEGVERIDQATRLCELGCRSAQGWLYSKAVPASEFARLIDRELAPDGSPLG